MTERPIIFSAPMVRAILAGTKTQTRRVVKPQPSAELLAEYEAIRLARGSGRSDAQMLSDCLPCHYGQPGDWLWVREAWAPHPQAPETIFYRATVEAEPGFPVWSGPWKPSIHMPRFASRITLEITSVRVERLQDISEADAAAEGVTPKWEPGCSGRLMEALGGFSFRPAASAYADLWESLHGPGSWDANPWVWVVEFKRINQAGNT